tara:strand:- start:219 stop:428 length:210 start_codon:yes stop_codon:yes gene_type:complete
MTDTVKIKLCESLVQSAENHLVNVPKTVEEQIELWARLGRAAAENLTESQILKLLCGDADIRVIEKQKD